MGGPLVGRAGELAAFDALLEALGPSSPTFLALAGEPGIGKTRVLSEGCARARQRGLTVLTGRAAQFEADVPWAVFVDALDDRVGELSRSELARLQGVQLTELAQIFPALEAHVGDGEPSVQDERFRCHYAVRSLLEVLAGRRGLVLALDDVHWADEASLELVAYLLRRPPRAPVCLVLTYRPHEAPPLLGSLLARPADGLAAQRLVLRPLELSDALALVGDRVDAAAARAMHEESGGNPFYLEQLLRTGARAAAWAPEVVATPGVPRAVVEAVGEEVARLPPRARLFLDGAAVAGDPFEPEVAAAAAGLAEEEGLAALDELVAGDLVRPLASPRRFRFRHPIVRGAVYDGAAAGWRLSAHARVAGALTAMGAPAARRARHVEQSAHLGDLDAVRVLTEAGHEAAPRAPSAAATWFAAALRVLGAGDPDQRLGLLIPMATALGSAGRLEESRDALREAVELLDPAALAVRARVVAFIAFIEGLLGHREAGVRLLRQTLAELPAESLEAGLAMLELAADCFYHNDEDGQLEWASRANALAQQLGDRALAAEAMGLIALARYARGELDEAEARYREAAGLVDGLSDDELAGRLIIAFFVGWYGQTTHHNDDTIRFMDRGLRVSRATGQGHLLVPMMIGQAIAMTWQGRLAEAATVADDATEIARLSRNDQSLAWTLTLRCWVATQAGDLPFATACGEEALEAVGRIDSTYYSTLTRCYLAETRLESGAAELCRSEILDAAGGPALPAMEISFRAHFYEMLTRAELLLGDTDAAARWAEHAEAVADAVPIPARVSEARRARALCLLAADQPQAAADTALAAVRAAERYRAPVEAARARVIAGRALAAAGASERAVAELDEARRVLEAHGAARYRDEAARELRRLGRRVTRARSADRDGARGIDGLSERECEVARLIAAGRTNRAIAAELHLSEKTVEKHVSRMFDKVGVSGRAQLAAVVTRSEAAARR